MIKILDLFAGTQSVKKAAVKANLDFEYFGVDIYTPKENTQENIILDLSTEDIIEKLKDKLPKGWKPDFIWASPLCTTFSRATCIPNGTLNYEWIDKEKGIFKIREKFSHITHQNYIKYKDDPNWQKEQQRKGQLGLDLINNTKKIINYFNCDFAIENPAFALSRYILNEYNRNVTNYCMYGFNYKKTTAIYSNKQLNLKKCNHKGKHLENISGKGYKKSGIKCIGGNKNRSRVPEDLIKNIIFQLLLGKKIGCPKGPTGPKGEFKNENIRFKQTTKQ